MRVDTGRQGRSRRLTVPANLSGAAPDKLTCFPWPTFLPVYSSLGQISEAFCSGVPRRIDGP